MENEDKVFDESLVNDKDNNEKIYEEEVKLLVNGEELNQPFYVKYRGVLVIVGCLLFLTIVIVSVFSLFKGGKCDKLEDKIIAAAENYAKDKKILPTVDGDNIVIDIKKLYDEKVLDVSKVNYEEKQVSGTIKITKLKNTYLKTIDLKDSGKCSSNERYKTWSKETTKQPKKNIVDVTPYYNYYEVGYYDTKWTNYIKAESISADTSEYGVKLPKDMNLLPTIPSNSKISKVIKEDKSYYSYRDREWKYYKNPGNYSGFSSEQPAGYATKDTDTSLVSEFSEWSLNYPEEKSYRNIERSTGYRWYYKNKKGEKIYFNSGQYLPVSPDPQYTIRSKETVTLYRYSDTMWRWYNGQRRGYSSYNSVKPNNYGYRDEELTRYTSWTSFDEVSRLNDANKSYREERVEVRSRYKVEYSVDSLIILDKPISKEELEKKLGKSLSEIGKDRTIKLEVTYKYKYRK